MTARVHEAVLALIGAEDIAECVAARVPRAAGGGRGRAVHRGAAAGGAHAAGRDGGAPARRPGGGASQRSRRGAACCTAKRRGWRGTTRWCASPATRRRCWRCRRASSWTLDPAQGAGALAFLGRAVAAALGR